MTATPIDLVVGLGNPGERYRATRHNIGFMVLDRLAEAGGATFRSQSRLHGLLADCGTGSSRLRLLKPETFMNNSGQSVRATLDWFALPIGTLLVVVDDMDLPLGRLRLRREGGAGGHNGLRSLIQHLGSQSFLRLRIGIGAPGACPEERRQRTVGHVLGRFAASEAELLEDVLAEATRAPDLIRRTGIERAGTRLNSFRSTRAPADPVTAP
ncbi:aminoacyl-tRNA hydrolase [Synechococcus sp. RSCCF101]|uniref:aminoacyl-tRNA hydrolase n=1 Tax=Synechococcus sp. RSCCF101 TaxID=2511069 RepID=UPI001247B103|nr:aminoacyl-tRNA hydrolase [Synechococcus sp. RSCCF101]QEY32266.1 aminoacyl-tRNA hydrolase [Synechococcus sp. RSCCF101]